MSNNFKKKKGQQKSTAWQDQILYENYSNLYKWINNLSKQSAMFVANVVFIFLMLTTVVQIQNRPACIFAIELGGSCWLHYYHLHQSYRLEWVIDFDYEPLTTHPLVPLDRP